MNWVIVAASTGRSHMHKETRTVSRMVNSDLERLAQRDLYFKENLPTMVMMRAKQIWHVTSFADVLQLILGILTLVILFTGMFMVFSFSKFYPWYITKGEI